MVNENTQGVIPLVGSGHVHRKRGNYQPGEYKDLVNCEITESGDVMNRRPVYALTTTEDPVSDGLVNTMAFVGHYKNQVLFTSGDGAKQWLMGREASSTLWNPANLETLLAVINGDWSRIVGFFRYNKVNYWITCTFVADTVTPSNLKVYYDLYSAPDPAGASLSSVLWASLTKTPIFDTITDPHTAFPVLKAFFIHKERLWIVTQFKAYFSKATDPTVWAVPDGGFFNFLEDDVNGACAIRDSVYIISDNGIKVITYTNDPNTDASVKQVSDNVGGDSVVVVGDTVYFARDEFLYALENNFVSPVANLARFTWESYGKWKLFAFGNYVIANYGKISRTNFAQPLENNPSTDWSDPTVWPLIKDYNWTSFDYNNYDGEGIHDCDTLFVNTNNMAVHGFGISGPGNPSDFYFVPVEDRQNNQNLYIMTKGPYPLNGAYTDMTGAIYIMNTNPPSSLKNTDCIDYVVSKVEGIDNFYWGIPIFFEIDSYVPDGSEFFMKKFRNLLFEGEVFDDMQVAFSFDNSAYAAEFSNTIDALLPSAGLKIPVPLRVPINQRARALSIKIRNLFTTPDPFNNPTRFMLTRLVVLWSYTGRGPVSKNESLKDV